jgi:hypothetical protein
MVWRAGDQDAGDAWGIAVALELSTPKAGRLSLQYGTEGSDSTDNVESIVRKVRPALCRALDRLRDEGGRAREDTLEREAPSPRESRKEFDSGEARS